MNPGTRSPTAGASVPGNQERLRQQALAHLARRDGTLTWYFRLGTLLRHLCPARVYRQRTVPAELEKLGVPRDLGYKAMAFASCSFSQEQVRRLTRLGTTWSAVVAVLAVEDGVQRLRLLEEAADRKLSLNELRRLVSQRRGVPPPKGGKGLRVPVSCGPEVDLQLLRKLTARWRLHWPLWHAAASEARSRLARGGNGDQRARLLDLVKETEKELAGLRQQAGQLLEDLGALQRHLGPRDGRGQ
jgi:hypothetical protein